MHIRLNIPAWDGPEVRFGLKALLATGSRSHFKDRLHSEVARVLSSGWTPILLSSARYALTLALRSLGLSGQRVAVPGYVCPAVLTGLSAANVVPVPVDCEPRSIRLDPESLIRAAETERVTAVVAANTYGLDQDFVMLRGLGLPIIEDAAYQAGRFGADGSTLCGTRGDAGVWSFNFKALTGVGGGALLLRSEAYQAGFANGAHNRSGFGEAARFFNYALRSLARHRIPKFLPGAESPLEVAESTVRRVLRETSESTMSELQAGVVLAQWQSRDTANSRQRENVAMFANAIGRCGAFDSLAKDSEHPAHLFPVLVRVSDNDAPAAVHRARLHLYRSGVQTESAYAMNAASASSLPNAREMSRRLFLVPCNASLNRQQVDLISRSLAEASLQITREFRVSPKGETR